jgi:hypothetical protein
MNFITKHLIKKIETEIREKFSILKVENFCYFDEPVIFKNKYNKDSAKKTINRVNKFNPYVTEEIMPSSWYLMSGDTLIEIYDRVKNNDFYAYRKIDGRDHKIRIKRVK